MDLIDDLRARFGALDRTVVLRGDAPPEEREAILVVPGLGIRAGGWRALRAFFGRSGHDLFLPDYVGRGSLEGAAATLQAFIEREELARYRALHVYANILGAWAINRCLRERPLPNLRSLAYDRSPLQERAPRVATEVARGPVRWWFGSVVEDLAAAPYPPLELPAPFAPELRVGLLIETRPTRLIRLFRRRALRTGPLAFGAEAFGQPHHDAIYIPFDHDAVYTEIAAFGDELVRFFREGRFSERAQRTPPDPAAVWRR